MANSKLKFSIIIFLDNIRVDTIINRCNHKGINKDLDKEVGNIDYKVKQTNLMSLLNKMASSKTNNPKTTTKTNPMEISKATTISTINLKVKVKETKIS